MNRTECARPGSRGSRASVRVVALFPLLRHFAGEPGFTAILARYGIEEDRIRDSYGLIPLAVFCAILEDAAVLADDPLLGARLGAAITPGDLGPAGILLAQSATLRRGLSRYARSICALQGGTEMRLSEADGQLEFTYQVAGAPPDSWRQDAEMSLASTCNLIRTCFDARWRPVAVHFAHGPAERWGGLRPFFCAPIKFWQNANRLIFAVDGADTPVRKEDRDLLDMVARHVDDLALMESGRRADPVEAVRAVVARRLGRGVCTLPALAAELGIAPRTLQRQLAAQGTSLRGLIREQREKIAARHLAQPHRTVAEVAWATGYADGTVLWRAHKRWTGLTPTGRRHAVPHHFPIDADAKGGTVMTRVIKVKSGSTFEDRNAFCRVVQAGDLVFSSNTSGRDPVTGIMPDDPVEQMLQAIANIERALGAVGVSVSDAVRVQISLTSLDYQDALLAAFATRFAGIDPALTLICQPFVGAVKVEVEITAYKYRDGESACVIRMPAPR